jgi:hypothetical protein
MADLTADQILAADDLPREQVEVPEWGGTVWVRTLTGRERDAWEETFVKVQRNAKGRVLSVKENLTNIRARLSALVICDSAGTRLFTDAQVNELAAKSGAALDRVFDTAQRINKMSDQDIEELAGNLESGQSDDSGSDSR